jgi:hypothetical protein
LAGGLSFPSAVMTMYKDIGVLGNNRVSPIDALHRTTLQYYVVLLDGGPLRLRF